MTEAEITEMGNYLIAQLAIIWQSVWSAVFPVSVVLAWACILGAITLMAHMLYANIFPKEKGIRSPNSF